MRSTGSKSWMHPASWGGVLLALGAATTLAVGGAIFLTPRARPSGDTPERIAWDHPSVQGTIHLSAYGEGAHVGEPTLHTTEFVSGPVYSGFEDNDVRGFLDGTFKWGWNQPHLWHVRVGRRERSPRYGEHELFRVLQRWDDIALPAEARVVDAEIVLTVENPPAEGRRVELYAVNKDWISGSGGRAENSVSPPKPGEVWWNDVSHGLRSWSLPGISFASDDHPDADTPAMPLAETEYAAGDSTLVFSSDRLTEHVQARLDRGEPVLLLLKLADFQEDFAGTLLHFYSANNGTSRDLSRRPRLRLQWLAESELASHELPVLIEYGRHHSLKRPVTGDARQFAVTFEAEAGSARPTIELRGGRGSQTAPWQKAELPVSGAWEWIEVRVLSAWDPVALGQPFSTEFRNTWVQSASPEEQSVTWTFTAPDRTEHRVAARYGGDYRWVVEFVPDALGPWHYSWTHHFDKAPESSALGHFDVVGGGARDVLEQLAALRSELQRREQSTEQESDEATLRGPMERLARLEREAMRWQTPLSFRSAEGVALRARLNEVRGLLGEAVPDPIPMLESPAARWEWASNKD